MSKLRISVLSFEFKMTLIDSFDVIFRDSGRSKKLGLPSPGSNKVKSDLPKIGSAFGNPVGIPELLGHLNS